jgi:hypothetical protein
MVARPPGFSEQTEDVLTEFGFGREETAELRRCKVGDDTALYPCDEKKPPRTGAFALS